MINKIKLLQIITLLSITTFAQINPNIVDQIIEDEMVRQNLPGLAIGVYKKGVINYTKGYGFIDVNNKTSITNNTIMEWASISKTLTAVALFQVMEKNDKIKLDDTVIKHYKHWTEKVDDKTVKDKTRKDKITLKHLLTHRSGINHYSRGRAKKRGEYSNHHKDNYKSDNGKFNANSSVNLFREAKLDFNPGDKYLYTSYGYNLLGAEIDKKTNGYENWVNKNIKNKLGLSSLRVAKGGFKGFQKSTDGIIKGKTSTSSEWVLPSGGWESNVKDLLKFAKGILDGKLLKNTDSLWKDDGFKNSKNKPVKTRRGVLSEGSNNRHRIHHGGSHPNLKTFMYIKPNNNVAIVVMIPANYAQRENVVYRIINKMKNISPKYTINDSPLNKCQAGMKSSTKKFVGVWQKTNKDVIIRRGYTTKNFNTEWKFLTSKGYYLENLEFSNNLWNGIFKEGRGKYAMWRNFDHASFNKKWKEMNNKGYRLYDLETYIINGKRKWAGLFKKGSGGYAMYRNYSTKDFGTKRKELAKDGYKLIDIEAYNTSNGLKWAGVWVAGKDGLLNRNYNESEFKVLVNNRDRQGYKLIDVETYKVNGKRKWAGIWEKSSQEQRTNFGEKYCNFMKLHDTYSNQFELIDIISY
jgi:CubicO group peptidase (beta-lactamase class C family)